MRSRLAPLPLLALGLALAPGAAAQAGADTVPSELVRALLFPYVFAGLPEPAITVGRPPPGIPAGALPAGAAEVLGGMVRMQGSSEAVVMLPLAPVEAIAGYQAQLERAGWRRSPDPEFASRPDARVLGVCADGIFLAAGAFPRPGGGSALRLSVAGREAVGGEFSRYCEGGAVRERIDHTLLPPLRPPPDVRHGSGGSSSTAETQEQEARFETTLGPAELAAHFAGQLREAGWTTGAPAGTGEVATVRAERRDTRGHTWHGLLAVVLVSATERDVLVRVARASTRTAPSLVPAVAPGAAARVEGPVPARLVRELLVDYGGTGDEELPEIVVGRLPPGVPAVALPPGADVLGGAAYLRRSVAIVAVPGAPAEVIAGYRRELERAGWRGEHPFGFVRPDASLEDLRSLSGMFCGPEGMDTHLLVSASARKEGGSYLRLESRPAMPPCRREHLNAHAEIPLPALRAPEGATLGNGGSWGGTPYASQADTRLQTPLGPAEVVGHYAAQLREAGWTTHAPASDGSIATLAAELRDAQGRTWQGLLAAIALSATERDVLVRVMRPDPW